MNQVRYITYACFIILAFVIGLVTLKPFLSSDLVKADSHTQILDAGKSTSKGASLSTEAAAGKTLFQQNCQTCHALNKALTGPALADVAGRGPWGDRRELYKWIHNPPAYIASDKTGYTKGLQEQYKALMTPFPQLSEKDIDNIVAYLNLDQSYINY